MILNSGGLNKTKLKNGLEMFNDFYSKKTD